MIRVQEIRKRYGKTAAIGGVSFEIPDGMVTGLLGPNGAGKTTTIRAMTGLVTPESGRIEIDGIDVAARPIEARARLGVVPETIGVYDHLTVREHVEYSAELHGMAPAAIASSTTEVLAHLDLAALADRRAAGLSMGERRRLALARAMVHRPANLLFDEPTNGLDVLGARTVRSDIRRLAELGRAVLVSSHVMPEVAALCDRVIVMVRGVIVAAGRPAEHAAADRMRDARRCFRSNHRIRRGVELMRAWRVARKELREGLRDRRSLMSGLFYGIWGPAVMGAALIGMARQHADLGTVTLPTAGAAHAPSLVAFLATRKIIGRRWSHRCGGGRPRSPHPGGAADRFRTMPSGSRRAGLPKWRSCTIQRGPSRRVSPITSARR